MKRFVVPVLGSLLAALLLGELMLRALGYSAAVWYQPVEQLGWRLRPGVGAWFTREGRAFVQVNSAGLRDDEHALAKPVGVYRIAVLGDSYSEAMQVAREEAYWALLPEHLHACGFQADRKIEVVNFGVSGYGTAQEYRMLESTALRYRPDLVLLQFTNGNDVQNNSAALDDEKGRPFYRLAADGTLRLDESFTTSDEFRKRGSMTSRVGRQLADYSRVVQLARATKEDGLIPRAHAKGAAGIEEGLSRAPLAPPASAQWEDAWRVTEALIAKTAGYAEKQGARFMLFTVPYAIQVHPDPGVRAAVRQKLGVEDLFYPDRRLTQLGLKHHLRVLALAPEMQRIAEKAQKHFHGFPATGMGQGHWNAEGHRAAAGLIARHLCESL